MEDAQHKPAYYILCNNCTSIRKGSLRCRCANCKESFISCSYELAPWSMLEENKIECYCYSCEAKKFTEFYFKCETCSNRNDTTPLRSIDTNINNESCPICLEVKSPVVVFQCECIMCIDCWRESFKHKFPGGFMIDPVTGFFGLNCIGRHQACISEPAMFKVLGAEAYAKYKKFATEDRMKGLGGVTCPLPKCHNAIFFPVDDSDHLECPGCQQFFCKRCNVEVSNCSCENPKISATSPSDEFTGTFNIPNTEAYSRTLELQVNHIATKQILNLSISDNNTVVQMKQLLSMRLHISPSKIELLWSGCPLPNETVLSTFHFANCSMVMLVVHHTPTKPPPSRRIDTECRNSNQIPYKRCPDCKAPIVRYKKHGCHHLRCANRGCTSEFCFICLQTWKEDKKSCTCPIHCTPNCNCPICPDCKPGKGCVECSGCPGCRVKKKW